MRDPQRIKTICELIEKTMMINPDMRFGQLLVNCRYLVDTMGDAVIDPFYYEDDRLIDTLTTFIQNYE